MKRAILGAAIIAAIGLSASSAASAVFTRTILANGYHTEEFDVHELRPVRFRAIGDFSKSGGFVSAGGVVVLIGFSDPADPSTEYGQVYPFYFGPSDILPGGLNFIFDVDENWDCNPLVAPTCLYPELQFISIDIFNHDSSPLHFSISITAVPEPTTWALMILGFGASGAALRRSRVKASARSAL